ncbi:MAG: site-2 protease family protein, partial [Arenimonas sp.]|uniref:site-2 protease family protein n=1 Tax=Arenimonas sp. TaxID=1872635 RepID=UPI003C0DB34B
MSDKAPAKTFTLKKIFSIVVFAVLGMGVGFFIGKAIKTMPELTSRLDALQMWDLLLLPISFLFVLAVHEAGHLLGGFRKGMRFLLYIVGPFQLTRTASGIRFNWIFNLGTFGGLAAATPDPEQPIRPQFLSLIAGGPLASLLLAALGVAVFLFTDGRFSAHALLIALFSALIFLVTAVPSRAGGFMSDGMQFIEVLRGGDAVMERQQLTGLMAQSMAGIRPRDWKAEWLEPAAQAGVGDPMRRVAVRLMALLRAEDSGDTATADAHADWLAEHTDDYPQGFRQSLTIELCLHALSRGNATAAKMWMAQSKGGVV